MTCPRGGQDPEDAASESAERFILSGPPDVLAALGPVLDRDPSAKVISVAPRGAVRPERIVVEMLASRAAVLDAALGAAVIVEPDHPVTPPSAGPAPK